MNLKFWQLGIGNWTLRIDRFVGAGSPTIIAPKQTISKTRPHSPNKQAKFTFRFTVGWGRVYLNCLSLLSMVGEPAPTTF